MAADTVVRFTAHVQDASGIKGTIVAHLYIDGAQTVTAVKGALDTWITDLDPLTECSITAQSIQILPPLVAGLKAPVAGAEIEETANLDFSVATVPYHWGLTLLGFPSSKLTGNQVNLTDTAVAAMITLMKSAVLGGTYTDRSARSLVDIAYTFQGERKRRRRLHEISYTPA